MPLTAVFAIAAALSMDAFAVSLSTGMGLPSVSLRQTLRMAGTFGAFQFLMPVAGWLAGVNAQSLIKDYDHWLAFGLLAFVGGRMLLEALKKKTEAGHARASSGADAGSGDTARGGELWLLGVATSLDALAVGISLALLQVNVWLAAAIIGCVCFCLSACGMHLGSLLRRLPGLRRVGDSANALGGVVLLAIAVKILHEHGVFS